MRLRRCIESNDGILYIECTWLARRADSDCQQPASGLCVRPSRVQHSVSLLWNSHQAWISLSSLLPYYILSNARRRPERVDSFWEGFLFFFSFLYSVIECFFFFLRGLFVYGLEDVEQNFLVYESMNFSFFFLVGFFFCLVSAVWFREFFFSLYL